jgi:ligand-binding sensor domain-containing protein
VHSDTDPHSLIDNPVRAIYEDSFGNFWVGTSGDGLHTMDRAAGSFTRYNYDRKHAEKLSRPALSTIPGDHITFITEDEKGAIWIGAMWGGLVRYDPRNKRVERFQLDSAHKDNYTNTAWWEFTSRDGEMWVSNFYEPGIFRFDPAHQNVAKIRTEAYMDAFVEEHDSIRWIGTSAGLARVDKKNNDTAWFRHDAQKAGSISTSSINVLYKDRHSRIWARTHGGLNLFNPDKRNFTTWLYNKNVRSGLGDSDKKRFMKTMNQIYGLEQTRDWIK